MTYAELVKSLTDTTGLRRYQVDAVLWALRKDLPRLVRDGGALRMPGLGTFLARHRKGRRIRHPSSKEFLELSARTTLGFRPDTEANRKVGR